MEWIQLARQLFRILETSEINGATYLDVRSLKHRANVVLQLARKAYELLQQAKEEEQWGSHQTLRCIVILSPLDKPVSCSEGGPMREVIAARAVVKLIMRKCEYPLPPATSKRGARCYRLDPSLVDLLADIESHRNLPLSNQKIVKKNSKGDSQRIDIDVDQEQHMSMGEQDDEGRSNDVDNARNEVADLHPSVDPSIGASPKKPRRGIDDCEDENKQNLAAAATAPFKHNNPSKESKKINRHAGKKQKVGFTCEHART